MGSCSPLLASRAEAIWQSDGAVVCVTPAPQTALATVPDGSGGAIVLWKDLSTGRPMAQRMNDVGEPTWPIEGVVVSDLARVYSSDLVAQPDGAGGAFIVWSDRRAPGDLNVRAQRIDGQGNLLWGPDVSVCESRDDQIDVTMARDDDGGILVAWRDDREGTPDVYAQRLTEYGIHRWYDNGVAVCVRPEFQGSPAIASDGAHGAIVAWLDTRYGFQRVFAQRLDQYGSSIWDVNGRVMMNGSYAPSIVTDGAGGAYVTALAKDQGAPDVSMCAQHVDSTGMALWSTKTWFGDAGHTTSGVYQVRGSDLMADGQGGLVVAWCDYPGGDVYARHVDGLGNVLWSAELTETGDDGQAFEPAVTADDSGGVIVAWQNVDPLSNDVWVQRLDPDGAPMWTASGLRLGIQGQQMKPVVVGDGFHGVIVAWTDGRVPSDLDVYAGRVLASGQVVDVSTAIAVSVAAVQADVGRVALSWYFAGDRSAVATVYRRWGDANWEDVGDVRCDGDGYARFEDRWVEAGASYTYRLGITTSAGPQFFGETAVTVPIVPAFGLTGTWPNPVTDRAVVAFSIAQPAPARLEVLDASGRRLAMRDVAGVGQHRIELSEARAWPPGMYVVRLTQGGRTAVSRMAVIR